MNQKSEAPTLTLRPTLPDAGKGGALPCVQAPHNVGNDRPTTAAAKMGSPSYNGSKIATPAAALSHSAVLHQVHADRAIADMAAEFVANAKEREEIYEPSYHVVGYRFPADIQERLEKLRVRREELMLAISTAEATSIVGYRAKALVLMDQYAPGGPADAPGLESDEYLAWSLCRDLLAGAGA